MVGGGVQDVPDSFEPSPHVHRAYRNSECRVAIAVSKKSGCPFLSVAKLSRENGSALWTIEMKDEKAEQNALDYIEVGLNNGDWVYLSEMELASQNILRKIGVILSTLRPDPKNFPRRERFRLWLVFDSEVSLDENVNPQLPQLLAQHCIVAHKNSPVASKWVKRLPQEPELFQLEMAKHQSRRDAGRHSDSESDDEENPGRKIVGKWFSRSVEFHHADTGSASTQTRGEIFNYIKEDNFDKLLEICKSGQVNLTRLKHPQSLMTPLQFAVSNEKLVATKILLDFNADPNQPRETDGCPPLFMSIECRDLVSLLIERGANADARYEGYTVEKHPSTDPDIANFIKELKGR